MMDHHLLDERPGTHRLKRLVYEYTDEAGCDEKVAWPIDRNPLATIAEYNCKDAIYTYRLSKKTWFLHRFLFGRRRAR